jgi:hypothetical protein
MITPWPAYHQLSGRGTGAPTTALVCIRDPGGVFSVADSLVRIIDNVRLRGAVSYLLVQQFVVHLCPPCLFLDIQHLERLSCAMHRNSVRMAAEFCTKVQGILCLFSENSVPFVTVDCDPSVHTTRRIMYVW